MSHPKSIARPKFGRKKDYREMMLKNLLTSVVLYENVTTTTTKAKVVKKLVDKILSGAFRKNDKREAHKYLNKYLMNDKAILKVLDEIKVRMEGRTGGYVSVVGAGFRVGDGAPLSKIILLKGNEIKKKAVSEKEEDKSAGPKKTITGKEKVTVKRKTVSSK